MGRYGRSERLINHTLHIAIQFFSYYLELLKLEGIVRNAYYSYLAHLTTFLFLACRRVEISTYGKERVLIVVGTSQYFLSLDMLS